MQPILRVLHRPLCERIGKIFSCRADRERSQDPSQKRSERDRLTGTDRQQASGIRHPHQKDIEAQRAQTAEIYLAVSYLLQQRIASLAPKGGETLSAYPYAIAVRIRYRSEKDVQRVYGQASQDIHRRYQEAEERYQHHHRHHRRIP